MTEGPIGTLAAAFIKAPARAARSARSRCCHDRVTTRGSETGVGIDGYLGLEPEGMGRDAVFAGSD